MLILTRNLRQSIIIDNDIKITVLSDNKGYVTLGIEAPDDIDIWREELYQKIKDQENNT